MACIEFLNFALRRKQIYVIVDRMPKRKAAVLANKVAKKRGKAKHRIVAI